MQNCLTIVLIERAQKLQISIVIVFVQFISSENFTIERLRQDELKLKLDDSWLVSFHFHEKYN